MLFASLSKEEHEIRDHLKVHIQTLAGDIGERNVFKYPALEASAHYIEKVLRDQRYEPAAHEFEVHELTVRNLEVELRSPAQPQEIIIVGAHYDSVFGCPGANDNATGVAAMLEIARLLRPTEVPRTVRFVAFVNEEPPFFQTEEMGSWVYAKRCRRRGEKIIAMISLETIGYYSDAPKSQTYPLPFSLLYPSEGNFIGFVGNIASRQLVRRSIRTFRQNTGFPSEGVGAPGWIPGIGWSDHWAFWKEGYPGVMVTDTALYRYRHYHTREDTPDKIDYDRMARVVGGLVKVVEDLAR
ncbi:MAG TPA: M28 family peptidase [Acidobacteriota bacterium]|nr:M28 family peptidase [Acidobacteriota bacterium]